MDAALISAWAAFVVAGMVIWLGVFATVLPVLPGTLIVWLGVLVHRLWMGADSVSWNFVGLTFLVVVLAQVLDTVLSVWGARRYGATWKGALGALVGGVIGIFLGPVGMLLGTIVGAVLFEWIEMRDHARATQAGLGTLVGMLAATVAKLAASVVIAACFYAFLPKYPWNVAD